MLKVRKTYSFDYKRHTYVGRLLKVRDVTVDQLSWATMFRKGEPTRRSQFLHTFKCANGRIISTYDEGMSNVKRLGPFRRLAVWFSGVFRPTKVGWNEGYSDAKAT